MAFVGNYYPVHGEGTTGITLNRDIPYNNYGIVLLENCNAQQRCTRWLGALNGQRRVGCGINVMRFLGEIDEPQAQAGLRLAQQGEGTPFTMVATWFNRKLAYMGLNNTILDGRNYTNKIVEWIYDISTRELLETRLMELRAMMTNNSCIIAKLNRNVDEARAHGLTPGHYVLFSKHNDGNLYTYEPYASDLNNCVGRLFRGVSDNFFATYQRQFYTSLSIMLCNYITQDPEPMNIAGGGNEPENIFAPFSLNEEIVKDFDSEIIDKLLECDISGGKLQKSKRRKSKRRKSKRRKSKQRRSKQKM